MNGATPFEWLTISGTAMEAVQTGTYPAGQVGGFDYEPAYCGAAMQHSLARLWFGPAGGHSDSCINAVYMLDFLQDAPAWTRRRTFSTDIGWTAIDNGSSHYNDGKPAARHNYWQVHFIEARNRLMTFGAPSVYGNSNGSFDTVDAFDPDTNDWEAAGTYPSRTGIGYHEMPCWKAANEDVYYHTGPTGVLHKWTEATNSWSSSSTPGTHFGYMATALDTTRNRVLRTQSGQVPEDGEGYYDLADGSLTSITFTGASAADITEGSLAYDSANDCYWFWKLNSTTLYRIHPTTWAVTTQATTGTVVNTYTDARHRNYRRFDYCPRLGGLYFMRDANTNVRFLPTWP